jgi:hypothetical protein
VTPVATPASWLTVKEALASALGLYPDLKVFAFMVVLLDKVIVPVKRVEDCVGVEPLVV